MNAEIEKKYKSWLGYESLEKDLKDELLSMPENVIEDAFYRDLEFGTGGLRGTIGAGTNRMNVLTVAKASQGYADYINAKYGKGSSVAISYDSRIKSDVFAKKSAEVFAANGIKVYIYPNLSPVPTCSFATRYYKCQAGVMITASHNPSKYNGFKAYGPDGCQLTTEGAAETLAKINALDIFKDIKYTKFEDGIASGMISYIGPDCLTAYLAEVKKQSQLGDAEVDKNVAIVYTPLNGSGLVPVTRVLKEMGFNNVSVVKEQEKPDGNFPTCPYPNPEIYEAMQLGMKTANEKGADLLMATDPDCDRVGCAVKGKDGKFVLITGNQCGLLLIDYICKRRIEMGTMPKDPLLIKTIVTTDLADKLAASYGLKTINVLTGFKYIGEQIGYLEEKGETKRYVFGFEESYGCLAGTYVRDKDAVVACMLIAEMFAYYKAKGLSFLDLLADIYKREGYCMNTLYTSLFEGASGFAKMTELMNGLRTDPVKEVAGVKVVGTEDYLNGFNGLPKSDVVKLRFEDGCTATFRPSGTEPKLKMYFSVLGKDEEEASEKEKAFHEFFAKRLA
ncbi:MAG: phospho-sugar mutase [Bacilli bacterium]|nr:phospho-sugar mutase [Bacilli bacterium]